MKKTIKTAFSDRLTAFRIIIVLILSLYVFADSKLPVETTPKPISEIDKTIEAMTVKDCIKSDAEQWSITKVWYQRVTMPDGSIQELKSKVKLTPDQWLLKAKELYKAELEAQKEPDICPYCGRPM